MGGWGGGLGEVIVYSLGKGIFMIIMTNLICEVTVYSLGKGIFMIIMTNLICGRIWVNFTYISWGIALRCFRDLFVSFYS